MVDPESLQDFIEEDLVDKVIMVSLLTEKNPDINYQIECMVDI